MYSSSPERGRGLFLIAAWIQLALVAGPSCLWAQLVVENPRQRWMPGAVVELVVRDPSIQSPDQIHGVLFDDRPIHYEMVGGGTATDPVRIRIRVPDFAKPGGHEVALLTSSASSEAPGGAPSEARSSSPPEARDSAPRESPSSALFEVPNIVGLTLPEARRRLEERGIEFDRRSSSGELPAQAVQTVTRQRPAAGARVRAGTRVAVDVVSQIEVPEISGLSLAEARQRLEAKGLELEVFEELEGAVVWTQVPAAGEPAALGTRIAVDVAVQVPDLIGRSGERTRSSLVERGLTPLIDVRETASGPFGTVLAQDPAAGEVLPPGSTVVRVEIGSQPDPPAPQWPWPWMMATAGLAGLGLGARARRLRLGAGLLKKFLAARDAQNWQRMYDLVEKMPRSLANSTEVCQQHSFALNRDGASDQAEKILRQLLKKAGPAAQTLGILGRVHKDRWDVARKAGDAGEARARLDEAIETYLEGHDADPGDPYPGINALTLMSFCETPHGRREELLRQLPAALRGRASASRSTGDHDREYRQYWHHATRIELALHQDDEAAARAAADEALASDKVVWMVATTLRNLRLVREAREASGKPMGEWVADVERALEAESG